MQVRQRGWGAAWVALVLPMCVACGQQAADSTGASADDSATTWTAPRTPWGEPESARGVAARVDDAVGTARPAHGTRVADTGRDCRQPGG